ncbi:putative methylesterase 14, chloroplastic [Selaginella moellendorffii]|uniref:putative methylesterase 14, chloroplastic n=1 Tax=Selaginella moellendorffii TaxID=88036 RepID=UPI000D1CD795|nr:putative methylesterase 14, chloroplastic [Selaginella moellendorffii]|eukprot:XP_024542547.1 putative methylesterase 14, chloroplastic [Selaginella moellendorffii]
MELDMVHGAGISAGINSQNATTVGTLENYTTPLTQLIQSLSPDDKVVLVGHSLGGLSVTYILEKFPEKIMAGVYLAAVMLPSGPEGGAIFSQIVANLIASGISSFVNGSTAAAYFKLDQVQKYLYNISPLENVELAKSLLKPCPIFDGTVNFTSTRYGTIPRYFIKTLSKDKLFLSANQEDLIRRTPPKEVLSIDSDHSPFFSKHDQLVRQLLEIAKGL